MTIDVTSNDTLGAAGRPLTPQRRTARLVLDAVHVHARRRFHGHGCLRLHDHRCNARSSTAVVEIAVTAPPPPSPSSPRERRRPTSRPRSPARRLPQAGPGDLPDRDRPQQRRRHRGVGARDVDDAAHLAVVAGSITIDGVVAGDACTVTGAVIACALGSLVTGDGARIAWRATVSASTPAGSLTVRAVVGSATADPVPADNSSTGVLR